MNPTIELIIRNKEIHFCKKDNLTTGQQKNAIRVNFEGDGWEGLDREAIFRVDKDIFPSISIKENIIEIPVNICKDEYLGRIVYIGFRGTKKEGVVELDSKNVDTQIVYTTPYFRLGVVEQGADPGEVEPGVPIITPYDEAVRLAKSWAVGPNSTEQNPNETNNAKYWSDKAEVNAENARRWAVGPSFPDKVPTDINNAKYWSDKAEKFANILSEAGNNESERIKAEKERQNNESIRQSNETARIANEKTRGEKEDSRKANEADRVEKETARINAEAVRKSNEEVRVGNEQTRENSEAIRSTNETARGNAEKARNEAETARNSAESSRATAETNRDKAETTRVQNEEKRVNAESSRATAEGTRATNEQTRIEAEKVRNEAESNRVTAETSRIEHENTRETNEDARANAETNRNNAETARNEAETARDSAESLRVQNEIQRQSNETARKVWEGYNQDKTYYNGNKVSLNGNSYVCVVESTTNHPGQSNDWLLIAQKGDGLVIKDKYNTIEELRAANPNHAYTYQVEQPNSEFYIYSDIARDWVSIGALGSYTAGTGIEIIDGVISATAEVYKAGDGISITNSSISARLGSGLKFDTEKKITLDESAFVEYTDDEITNFYNTVTV